MKRHGARIKKLLVEEIDFIIHGLAEYRTVDSISRDISNIFGLELSNSRINGFELSHKKSISAVREQLSRNLKNSIPIANVYYRQKVRQDLVDSMLKTLERNSMLRDTGFDKTIVSKFLSKDETAIIKTINEILASAAAEMKISSPELSDDLMIKMLELSGGASSEFISKGLLPDGN